MSFIWDDPNLINELLKSGQDFENRFTRHGQAAVDANAALNQILEKLELQLHPENRDPNAPPDISTQLDQPAVLNSTALESLGALCSFLAHGAVTVDGQRVSYAENPNNENYQFVKLEGNALFNETPDRQIQTQGFYVNIDLLKKYLNSLLAQLHQKPNTVMQVQVSKIIDEANQSLDTGLGKTYTPPAASLPDNQVLDNVPKDFKKQDPAVQPGPIPLTFGDIKSIQTFNGWLNDKSISMDGRMINHPQFDKCGVATILHTRAKALLGNARDDKQKNMYTLYMQGMEKIASSIEGCNLSGSATTDPNKNTGAGGATQGNIDHAIDSLPLRPEDIDFGRIREFFEAYRLVLAATPAASIQAAMTNAESAMNTASSQTETGMDNFPMSANIQQIGTWLKQPKGQTQAFGLVEQLRYVISNVAAVIAHFKNAYRRQLDSQAQSAINGQIGNEANSQGIAGNNLNHLQVWYNQAQSQSQQGGPSYKQKGW